MVKHRTTAGRVYLLVAVAASIISVVLWRTVYDDDPVSALARATALYAYVGYFTHDGCVERQVTGLDPEAIDAVHRIQRRLGDADVR